MLGFLSFPTIDSDSAGFDLAGLAWVCRITNQYLFDSLATASCSFFAAFAGIIVGFQIFTRYVKICIM